MALKMILDVSVRLLASVKSRGDPWMFMKTGKRLEAKRPTLHKGKKEDPNMPFNVTSVAEKEHLVIHSKDKKAVACMRRQMAPLANLQTVLNGGE